MSYTLFTLFLSLYLITAKGDTTLSCDESCDKCLYQTDFNQGTYRIKGVQNENKKYCLAQDITFDPTPSSDQTNPNTPFESCFPTNDDLFPGCIALSNGAFALGYFAAITIEIDNIELDLNNHEIKMGQTFYIQRYFAIIEIGVSPYTTGRGPADFGENDNIISNTYIHDGILGLSSHSGLHSNNAHNTTIENMRVCEFETAGIQFNGFVNLKMNNLIIGPSSTQVKPCGYYSNAKFLSLALNKLINTLSYPEDNLITFNGGRIRSIQQIYDTLITSLDIAFRYFIDSNTDNDINNELYDISVDLYSNPMLIPDGASIYGISLNSAGISNQEYDGENVKMSNIKISDLKLNVNEIPAVYFDQCNDPLDPTVTILKGPFGDVMDFRRMVGDFYNGLVIDLGDDYTQLEYIGNPLSDAQIALGLYGDENQLSFGVQGQTDLFLKWALNEYEGESLSTLPVCTAFACNGDIMFHSNKGIMGLRMDNIEDVRIENIIIKKLVNKSPLASYACSNYSDTTHDGGSLGSKEIKGGLGTDVKGICITGGDSVFDGYNNVIQKLVSYNGDVIGLDIKNDAVVEFDYVYKNELPSKSSDYDTEDDKSSIQIKQLAPGHEITFGLLAELLVDGKYPYPNSFYACNIKIENKQLAQVQPYPPNGIEKVWCADYVPDEPDALIGSVLPADVAIDAEASDGSGRPGGDDAASVQINIPENNNAIDLNNNDKLSDLLTKNHKNNKNVYTKYPNTPYVFFVVGLICIIMVVFVLVTFIMKCGKIMMDQDQKYKKGYGKASFDDSDSDSDMTDDEENMNI